MYELERIVLHNWGRLASQDIDVRGSVAVLGPTGAGKSTIIDALQVIITGGSSTYYDLNKSTGGRNERTIRDYCLGFDSHISTEGPERNAADALIALVFRDRLSGTPVTIGLILSAHVSERLHDLRARFVAPGLALHLGHLIEARDDGRQVVPVATRLIEKLKQLCPGLRNHAGSAISYVDDYLLAMRPKSTAPDSRQVLRNFKESIAFEPIDDPTLFVRKHILEEDHIDVEALKGSIERYRFLESEVKKREQQLEEIVEARRRMQVWAQHIVRHNMLSFQIAHAERRRLDLVIERLHVKRDDLGRDIVREQEIKRRHEQAIHQYGEDILRLKSLLAEAPASTHLRSLDAERTAELEKQRLGRSGAQRRLGQLLRLGELTNIPDRVPLHMRDALAAARELVTLTRGRAIETLMSFETELVTLERRLLPLVSARQSLLQQEDGVRGQLSTMKGRMDELEQAIGNAATGAILSQPVRDFIQLLKAEGISATPLPDIVDVSDPAWAMALEMLLGPNREALLIAPDHVAEAFELLYRNRNLDRGKLDMCRLIDTRKTRGWRGSTSANSIAAILVTTDADARAFIERQVGRFERAETDDDLRRMEQAITKRGKTTAGMGLRVYRDIQPIFGKTAQRSALERAKAELAELSESYRALLLVREALTTALAAITATQDEPADALAACLGQIADADAALRGNAQAREQAETPETRKTRDEIKALESDIRGYRTEIIEDIEPRIKELHDADTRLQIEIGVNLKDQEARKRDEQQAEAREAQELLQTLIGLIGIENGVEQARARVAVAAEMAPMGKDPAALLADMVARDRPEADGLPRLADESVKRGRTLFIQFVNLHIGSSPIVEEGDVEILRWCQLKERQLEQDELRHYHEAFREARIQMEKDLTEGLINRLSDKFQKARAQIEKLNRNLDGRKFTGQTYAFRYHINQAMKPVHVLADAIARAPQAGLAILEDEALDPRVKEGFRELMRRLGDEALVKDLQDYRKFFDFDLEMTNANGQVTTLSKRSVTGSGGQKQAPYYVAVGAAMAAAYYPKSSHDDPEGVGLVVFDEAFNNLDAPNTQSLLSFFADLHLQIIVAAPDKVRGMFLETVDTIVSVNRRPDTQEPVITVTYPRLEARQALIDANPAHRGIEAYAIASQAAAE